MLVFCYISIYVKPTAKLIYKIPSEVAHTTTILSKFSTILASTKKLLAD